MMRISELLDDLESIADVLADGVAPSWARDIQAIVAELRAGLDDQT